jgi:hypothetical protein
MTRRRRYRFRPYPYRRIGSDLEKVDAHVISPDEYDEIPDLSAVPPKTWAEARAAALRQAAEMTPEEDAEIQRGIDADPDTVDITNGLKGPR